MLKRIELYSGLIFVVCVVNTQLVKGYEEPHDIIIAFGAFIVLILGLYLDTRTRIIATLNRIAELKRQSRKRR